MDKSATYVDVVYMRYFIGLEHIYEYNWGHLFGLHVVQVSWRLYVEDKIDGRKLHTVDDNIFPSFSVCV